MSKPQDVIRIFSDATLVTSSNIHYPIQKKIFMHVSHKSKLSFDLIVQAARALANLAAHGDSNGNNAAVGQESGALDALLQLTRSPSDGVR